MRRLFEEFLLSFKHYKESLNRTGNVFLPERVVVEGESEVWVEWRHHWKVPNEINDDSQKTLLLLTVIFFVQMKGMPFN